MAISLNNPVDFDRAAVQSSLVAVEDHKSSAAHCFIGEIKPNFRVREWTNELVAADGGRRQIGRVDEALGHPRYHGPSIGDCEEVLFGQG